MLRPWLLVACLCVGGSAAFAQGRDQSEYALDLSGGTHFPVSLGVDAQLEMPHRILSRAHLGMMPPGYIDVINATATGLDFYDDATADLIAAAVEQTIVVRIGAGYRPLAHRGLELGLGYTLAFGGGSLTSSDNIAQASGQQVGERSGGIPITSTLHALHVDVGWRWHIETRWVLCVAVGYLHTVAASTNIDVGRDRQSGPVRAAEAYVNDQLTSYTRSPELKLSFGARF